MPVPGTGQKVGDSPSGGSGYQEHISFDGPTLQASSRVTQDYTENLLGHRSGIFSDPTRGVSSGLQLVPLAYGSGLGPTVPAQTWYHQQRQRYDPENL